MRTIDFGLLYFQFNIIHFLFLFTRQGDDCRSPFVVNANDDSCSSLSVDDIQCLETGDSGDKVTYRSADFLNLFCDFDWQRILIIILFDCVASYWRHLGIRKCRR